MYKYIWYIYLVYLYDCTTMVVLVEVVVVVGSAVVVLSLSLGLMYQVSMLLVVTLAWGLEDAIEILGPFSQSLLLLSAEHL